jgi:hypothetical protein
MRWVVLLAVVCVAAAGSGCSAWIAHCGTDLGSLKTRQDVHAELGAPVATELTSDGVVFRETYRTRRKIADPTEAMGMASCFL